MRGLKQFALTEEQLEKALENSGRTLLERLLIESCGDWNLNM